MSTIKASFSLPSGKVIQIAEGDITQEQVDAIVNAANSQLQHGGGVAGAIASKGGEEIQEESDRWVAEHGPVKHGEPAFTTSGKLPCRYIIHAVGPVWGSGNEESKLADAVFASLALADRLKLESIAFPAISTGIFGFPKDLAASVIVATIEDYFTLHPDSSLEIVRITLLDHETLQYFIQQLE